MSQDSSHAVLRHPWPWKRVVFCICAFACHWLTLGNGRPLLIESIDLNRDGFVDFELREGFTNGPGEPVGFSCYYPFGVDGYGLYGCNGLCKVLLATKNDCFGSLAAVDSGVKINATVGVNQSWQSGGEAFAVIRTPVSRLTNGPMATLTNMFAGVQFRSSEGTHFGWVELGLDPSNGRPKVVSFAWESTPGTSITAGKIPDNPIDNSWTPLVLSPGTLPVGSVQILAETNSATAEIRQRVGIKLSEEFQCLLAPGTPSWPEGMYPPLLVERSLLPNPLPPGWAWRSGAEVIPLLSRVSTLSGAIVSEYGTLAGKESAFLAIRKPGAETWWVELAVDGTVRYYSSSPAWSPRLLVGQTPLPTSPYNAWFVDIDGDGLIDFQQVKSPAPIGYTRDSLIPMRGQQVLRPTQMERFGTQISNTPPQGAFWSEDPVNLMEYKVIRSEFPAELYKFEGQIPMGTNGYIAVKFQSARQTHLGWIQYNFFGTYYGIVDNLPSVFPTLLYFDHGFERTPDAPVTIGQGSSLPFDLHISEEKEILRLTFPELRRGTAVVEVADSLDSPMWQIYPANNSSAPILVPKSKDKTSVYFRLRPPTLHPPIILP